MLGAGSHLSGLWWQLQSPLDFRDSRCVCLARPVPGALRWVSNSSPKVMLTSPVFQGPFRSHGPCGSLGSHVQNPLLPGFPLLLSSVGTWLVLSRLLAGTDVVGRLRDQGTRADGNQQLGTVAQSGAEERSRGRRGEGGHRRDRLYLATGESWPQTVVSLTSLPCLIPPPIQCQDWRGSLFHN